MIRMLKIFLPILIVTLALRQIGMAREFAEIYTDCGIGGMIAPRSDAVVAITNVTWDLGTTAISSNISSPDSCSGGQAEKAVFIHDSYDVLELDSPAATAPTWMHWRLWRDMKDRRSSVLLQRSVPVLPNSWRHPTTTNKIGSPKRRLCTIWSTGSPRASQNRRHP